MSGSIVRTLNWDVGYEQRFLAVNPIGDEVLLYQTNHEDPSCESNDIKKVNNRPGFSNIQCSAYSYYDIGLTSVGQINGTVCIFDITSNNSSILKLRPKQSRPCNSLSFNNKGMVAAGFDKGRQDNSLQIWNIEHYSRNSNNDHIKRPTYSYIPNEAILSSTFYPDHDSNLLAGSYKFLREVDLRTDVPTFQMATKCTLGITIDHFQSHLFLSFSEDGSLAIWDRRKLNGNTSKSKTSLSSNVITETPVLQFNKLLSDSSRKNHGPCVRYSTVRRGEFSAVFNGDLIRRWHTGIIPQSKELQENKPKITKDNNVLQSLKRQSSQLYKANEESLFVSMVLDVKTDYERVISFDYSSDISSNTSTNFVCMRQSGSVFRMPVEECIESIDFNSYNEFSIAGPEGTLTKFLNDETLQDDTNMKKNSEILMNNELRDINQENYSEEIDSTIDDDSVVANYGREENLNRYSREDEDFIPLNTFLYTSEVMMNDICSTIRRRSLLGYGIDSEKNIKVLEKFDGMDTQVFLKNTWKWLTLAKKSLDKGTMIAEGLDLGYQGVLGIWKGAAEINDQNRFRKDMGHITDQLFSHVVKTIVSSKGEKTASINISSNSEKKAQRKLCLIVSGWYLADSEFEEKLDLLISWGQYEKAAGWAVFHGNVEKAIEILASSKKERLRLMSTAVAGYLAYKSSNINSPWKDQCRKMASELDDPYLRAIFAFIADNDWWDVLDEHSLPLKERLGVALRFLSDKDLTVYLNRIADTVIAKGELEGLILTGITPKGIDLLQSYVDRTSDAQTAALISAFGCPRYFSDVRVNHWADCYRSLLNSWGMFSTRAKFDVARTKLSKNNAGQLTIKPAPKQVYLQCNKCNKNLSKPRSNSLGRNNASSSGTTGTNTNNPSALLKQFNKMNLKKMKHNFKSCPHCGAPLPRCAVCLLTLGTPIPMDSRDRVNDDTTSGRIENNLREWFSFCLSCNHGSHVYHAEEWFSKHYVCPVPDCNCCCNSK